MRTNVEIDEELLASVMKSNGLKTKRATIDHALRLARQMAAQRELLGLMGKVKWVGNLDEMRRD
jgi:Arc/MetJ family transcription regulator